MTRKVSAGSRRRVLAAGISTGLVGITLSGAGLAAASARPAVSGTLHFQIMTTSATSPRESIIATGVFTAGGVDHSGNSADKVVFPGGTFRIKHSRGNGPQTFNSKTCLFTLSQRGTYTLAHGTGRFKGIKGHGRYQISVMELAARSGGKCSQTKPPVAFQLIIRASGPAKL